jgi:hypothetical protein
MKKPTNILLFYIVFLCFIPQRPAYAQDDTTNIIGYYENDSHQFSFEFRNDFTFTIKEYSNDSWRLPASGHYRKIGGDTVAMNFPDSLLKMNYSNFSILFHNNCIDYATDDEGVFRNNLFMRQTKVKMVDSLMLSNRPPPEYEKK